MLEQQLCKHPESSVGMERSGSRLHPKVYLVERCCECARELDRKSMSRGSGESAVRREK
jgi:hypothetical protein